MISTSIDSPESQASPESGNAVAWLCESSIWSRLADFYQEKGKKAWQSEVPFQITSNPQIATAYVETLLAWLEGWIAQHGQPKRPIRIVELGAGHGVFSLMMLRALSEQEGVFARLGVTIHYVITDLVEANLLAWQEDPLLKPWLQSEGVSCAQWDCLADQHPWMEEPSDSQTPWVFVANYLFDSLPQDAYLFEKGTLKRGRAQWESPTGTQANDPNQWNLAVEFTDFDATKLPIATRGLLTEYHNMGAEGCILIPDGAIRCIETLRDLSQDRMLLLSSDKALSTQSSTLGRRPEEITSFASYSMLVNFHALQLYFQHEGGEAWLQDTQQEFLASGVFSIGHRPGTYFALERTF
ncbi:MAG TPA: hypothetical protein DCR93_26755, partial [Cytophagales bacterium]|nr:hypothetical protein [Cytophagales bacterium]